MAYILALIQALGLEISAPVAAGLIAAGTAGIIKNIAPSFVKWLQDSMGDVIEDIHNNPDNYTAKDKERIAKYEDSVESVQAFWKELTKRAGTEDLGAFGTLFVVPNFIYKAMLVLSKYIAKVGARALEITFPSGKAIETVQDLTEAIGYSYEQFTRDSEPASVTAWANIALLYNILKKGIPVLHIECKPNTEVETITEGVSDWYGIPWYDRCKHDFFLVPLKSITETEQFTIINTPYPGDNADWQDFIKTPVKIPAMTGGFDNQMTSHDFASCLNGLSRLANNDIVFSFNREKLERYLIGGVMYLPLFDVAGSTSFPVTSQLHSRSIYGVGEDALKEFLTNTYVAGSSFVNDFRNKFVKNTDFAQDYTLAFPNVVLHPMSANSESGGTNNVLDNTLQNPDWLISIAAIGLGSAGALITEKVAVKHFKEAFDAAKEDDLDLVTPGNVADKEQEEVVGDKAGDLAGVTAKDIADALVGTVPWENILEKIGSLVNTKTMTLIQDNTKTADEAIDEANETPGGYTGSIPPIGPGVASNSLISIWSPTADQLAAFTKKLWTKDLLDNLLKLLGDPMDACISLQKVAVNPITDGTKTLILGNYNTGIAMRHVSSQYVTMNLGGVNINPKYGTYLDMDPYTQIMLYLPFVGFVPISATMFAGHVLNVQYNCELLTGSCMAQVKREGTVIATYSGQCSMQLPITGQNYSRVISGAANGVMSGAPGGVENAVVSGVIGAVGNMQHTLQKSGTMSINSGFLGSFRPYVVISRPIPYSGNFQNVIGYTQNSADRLSSFSGYCQFREVTLQSDGQATEEEMELIKNDLMNGVIL